jgi:TetR/AcrR family transcriptional regulator
MSRSPTSGPAASREARSGDATRAAIFREAVRLFAERGYAGTSVRDISDASGVSTPVIYYHFGSKDGLYETVKRDLRPAPAEPGPLPLAEDLRLLLAEARSNASALRIGAWSRLEGGEIIGPGSPGSIARLQARVERARDHGEIPSWADPEALATMLSGLVVFWAETRPDPDDDERFLQQAIALIERGLAPSRQPSIVYPAPTSASMASPTTDSGTST